ncbi:sugar kinase [Pseudoduganella sp. LjRoot289]|uniref:sugar kinase n=1 Tax=Pseudoduganella sp. LjRoot289 TaxID=3342314 RepID=UPI003ECDF640
MTRAPNPKGRIVCFGEVLWRLSSPAGEMLLQSPALKACIGGAEANVAVSLAHLGHDAAMVSTLPDNALGLAARDGLRAHGVDTAAVTFQSGRMGLYFLTPGAVLRPSEIVYDRAGSAFARTSPSHYDWPALLDGAAWLHVSGVSPAVGDDAAQAVVDAMRAARSLGVRVAFDGNYRASMWAQRGRTGADVLCELMAHSDLAFADQRDIALVLDRPELAESAESAGESARNDAVAAAFSAFPLLQRMASTVRVQHSVDNHDLRGCLHTRAGSVESGAFPLRGIVDRIGTGDAFAAGVLHGLQRGWSDADTIAFGAAAGALKHAVAGDFSPASESQVLAIRSGGLDVRR